MAHWVKFYIIALFYCLQQLLNICPQSLVGRCAFVVGVLAEHRCNVALAVAVGREFVVVLLAVVGIALDLLLALVAQVTAYGLHYAHCHAVHYVVSLNVEICLVGVYAQCRKLIQHLLVFLYIVRELLFQQLDVVGYTATKLLQRVGRVAHGER